MATKTAQGNSSSYSVVRFKDPGFQFPLTFPLQFTVSPTIMQVSLSASVSAVSSSSTDSSVFSQNLQGSGSSSSVSNVSATISNAISVDGIASAVSSATADISNSMSVSGDSSSVSFASAIPSITVTVYAEGTSDSESSSSAVSTMTVSLSGSSESITEVSGLLGKYKEAVGSSESLSYASGTITVVNNTIIEVLITHLSEVVEINLSVGYEYSMDTFKSSTTLPAFTENSTLSGTIAEQVKFLNFTDTNTVVLEVNSSGIMSSVASNYSWEPVSENVMFNQELSSVTAPQLITSSLSKGAI